MNRIAGPGFAHGRTCLAMARTAVNMRCGATADMLARMRCGGHCKWTDPRIGLRRFYSHSPVTINSEWSMLQQWSM
jgi:hypothetical protein